MAPHPPRRCGRRRRHAIGGVRAADARRRSSSSTRSTTRSYKQEEAPRYHGRDVAIVRGREEKALVVLGSATPSMESYQHALSGKYAKATLERRVLDRPLAAVRLVNMREEYADQGPDVVIIARACVSDRRAAATTRAGAGAAQSPRLCDRCLLPPMRRYLRVPELHHLVDRAYRPSGMAGALPLLQLLDDGAEDLPEVRGAISRARWLRHREGRTASARAVSGGAHRQGRSRLGPAEGRSRRRCSPASLPASSTCSSGRR